MRKNLRILAAAAAILAGTAPVHATVIDFDAGLDATFAPFAPLLTHTDELQQNGFWIDMLSTKADAQWGDLVGALVGGADLRTCDPGLICPTNNSTQFLTAVNDGLSDVGRLDGSTFRLSQFNASFVAAVGDTVPAIALLLRVVGFDTSGLIAQEDFLLPGPDSNGGYAFSTYTLDSVFGSTDINEVAFYGYACDATGSCSRAVNKAFALDNITFVPEPASLALVGLALAGMAGVRRRQNKN